MDQEKSENQSKAQPKEESPLRPDQLSSCDCAADAYAALPPELLPKQRSWKTGLRKVTCPECRTTFWTNKDKISCPECNTEIVLRPVERADQDQIS
jgi:DNA-directed RNA polymerase subunit RPC12/RpoP